MLFQPSHWWHEVVSTPGPEGISIGVNYFFEPLYQRYNSLLPFFTENRFYSNLRPYDKISLAKKSATLFDKELFTAGRQRKEL